jgi:hypothetical protein
MTELVGRRATAKPGPAGKPIKEGAYSALIDDHGQTRAVVFADVAFAAYAGASLVMIPSGAAEDAIRARKVPQNLYENYLEVVNVMTSLFNNVNADHVKLGASVVLPGGTLPPEVSAHVTKPASKLDLEVAVDNYGKGRLLLLA